MTLRPAAWTSAIVLLAAACHTDAATEPAETLGPLGSGSDVRLTFNPDQNYWPTWTADGRGILYAFVAPGAPAHRCIGLLPAQGGTREWELCDNRSGQNDTVSSFGAYALDATGRLLYTEAVAPAATHTAPSQVTLWLADTAQPFARTRLVTMPAFLGSSALGWLSDLTWTGRNSFAALGQQITFLAHCSGCGPIDTVFADSGYVVTGTIAAASATIRPVQGTLGATGYALESNGSTLLFIRKHDRLIYRIPLAGGLPIPLDTVPLGGNDTELTGLSCDDAVCLVAVDPLELSDPDAPVFPQAFGGPAALVSVSLTTGAVQTLRTQNGGFFATPRIAPAGGDVVAQVGGNWGHLQTFAGAPPASLFLYRALVP